MVILYAKKKMGWTFIDVSPIDYMMDSLLEFLLVFSPLALVAVSVCWFVVYVLYLERYPSDYCRTTFTTDIIMSNNSFNWYVEFLH